MFIVVGVTGGIAAYKTVHLVRLLVLDGHDVHVIPTEDALRFVGLTDVGGDQPQSGHDLCARRCRRGEACRAGAQGGPGDRRARDRQLPRDDGRRPRRRPARQRPSSPPSAPVVVAPAMHTEMWRHPATVANVETLRGRGVHVVGPADGPLTGGDSGPGRMTEPDVDRRVRARRRAPRRRPRRAARRGVDRRNARADRPRPLHRQPLERPAGGRGGRRRRAARRPRARWSRRTSTTASWPRHPSTRASRSCAPEPPPNSGPPCARPRRGAMSS